MTVRAADDFAVIAARLRELEAERVAGLSRPVEDAVEEKSSAGRIDWMMGYAVKSEPHAVLAQMTEVQRQIAQAQGAASLWTAQQYPEVNAEAVRQWLAERLGRSVEVVSRKPDEGAVTVRVSGMSGALERDLTRAWSMLPPVSDPLQSGLLGCVKPPRGSLGFCPSWVVIDEASEVPAEMWRSLSPRDVASFGLGCGRRRRRR